MGTISESVRAGLLGGCALSNNWTPSSVGVRGLCADPGSVAEVGSMDRVLGISAGNPALRVRDGFSFRVHGVVFHAEPKALWNAVRRPLVVEDRQVVFGVGFLTGSGPFFLRRLENVIFSRFSQFFSKAADPKPLLRAVVTFPQKARNLDNSSCQWLSAVASR